MIHDDLPMWNSSKSRLPRGLMTLADIDNSSSRKPFHQHFAEMRAVFETLIESAIADTNAHWRDRRTMRAAIGLPRSHRPANELMCHLPTRHRAAEILFAQLKPLWKTRGARHWFFGTLVSDIGNSLAYAPHLELARLHRDGRKMLAVAGIQAIAVLDLRLAHYPLRDHGDTLEAHLHLLGYSDDPALTATRAEETIAARSVLSNWLGAPVAVFKILNAANDLELYCHYMFKAPLMRAGLVPDPLERSGFRMEHEAVDRWGALRLMEIFSHLSLRQATLAHGGLLRPKNQLLAAVRVWAAARTPSREPDFPQAFSRAWRDSPVRRPRVPPLVRFDARHPVDGTWNAAMQPMFANVAASQAAWDARRARPTAEEA